MSRIRKSLAALIKAKLLDQLGHRVTAYRFYTHQDLERGALLRTVDAVETDGFSLTVVKNLDGVTVEVGDDGAGEVSGEADRALTEKEAETEHDCGNCRHDTALSVE
jgi:hypothetical protein